MTGVKKKAGKKDIKQVVENVLSDEDHDVNDVNDVNVSRCPGSLGAWRRTGCGGT